MTSGYGPSLGAGGGGGPSITVTDADDVDQLTGPGARVVGIVPGGKGGGVNFGTGVTGVTIGLTPNTGTGVSSQATVTIGGSDSGIIRWVGNRFWDVFGRSGPPGYRPY